MSDKKLDGVSKRSMRRSERTKAHLAFVNMETRHINTDDVIDDSNIEAGELAEETENN